MAVLIMTRIAFFETESDKVVDLRFECKNDRAFEFCSSCRNVRESICNEDPSKSANRVDDEKNVSKIEKESKNESSIPAKSPLFENSNETNAILEPKWDGKSVIVGSLPWTEICRYKEVMLSAFKTRFNMCLRNYDDVVSSVVWNQGNWPDCNELVRLWNAGNAIANENATENDPEGVFVDVGANIGACILLMASLGHVSVGFEPSKANFFYLSSGVLSNDVALRSKIVLYNVGLGEKNGNAELFVAKGNAGNAILGTAVKDLGANDQTFSREENVPVRTLDDVLWPNPLDPPPHVRLMKMDAQGYELKILKGAQRLLKSGAVGVVKTELYEYFLNAQNDTGRSLISFMAKMGYDYIDEAGNSLPVPNGPIPNGDVLFKRKSVF